MDFDLRTLWMISAFCSGGFGVMMLLLRKSYPEHAAQSMTLWGFANLSLGLSYLLRIEIRWAGNDTIQWLSLTLVPVCLSLEYAAVCLIKEQKARLFWLIAPTSAMLAMGAWYTYIHPNVMMRYIAVNALAAMMMYVTASRLTKAENGWRPMPDVAGGGVYVFLGSATIYLLLRELTMPHPLVEFSNQNRNSVFYNVLASLCEMLGACIFVLMLSERLNRQLMVQAMRDELTGLYNRRAFEEIAYRELSGATRTGEAFAVLMFDVDNFKQVNDKFGHHAGDLLLKLVAKTLRECLRDEDYLCRWGGDEFYALLPRASATQAEQVVKRIDAAIAAIELLYEGNKIHVGISTGIVSNSGGNADFDAILRKADMAMYRAKQAGRHGYAFASGKRPTAGSQP